MDHSLVGNLAHPLARGIIINDIPVDLLKVFEIGFSYEEFDPINMENVIFKSNSWKSICYTQRH
jgi:hypothetical protein